MKAVLPPPLPAGPPQWIVSPVGVHVPVATPGGSISAQLKMPALRVPLAGARAVQVRTGPEGGVSVTKIESIPGVLTSRAVIVALIDAPAAALAVAGASVRKSSSVPAVTVIVAAAAAPSEVAVTVAVPALSPVMTPLEAPQATGGAAVANVTTAPDTTAPKASRTNAVQTQSARSR